MQFEKCPICKECVPNVNGHVYKMHTLREIFKHAWYEDQEGFWYLWAILSVLGIGVLFFIIALLDCLNIV